MRRYKRNVNSTKNLKKEYMEIYLSYFDDYDDDYFDDYFDFTYYNVSYDLKDNVQIEYYTRSNYFWPLVGSFYKNGKFYRSNYYVIDIIDMESFYSKEKIRSKRISEILDDNKDLSNTIENIINK